MTDDRNECSDQETNQERKWKQTSTQEQKFQNRREIEMKIKKPTFCHLQNTRLQKGHIITVKE